MVVNEMKPASKGREKKSGRSVKIADTKPLYMQIGNIADFIIRHIIKPFENDDLAAEGYDIELSLNEPNENALDQVYEKLVTAKDTVNAILLDRVFKKTLDAYKRIEEMRSDPFSCYIFAQEFIKRAIEMLTLLDAPKIEKSRFAGYTEGGISQTDFAKACGVSTRVVKDWDGGRTIRPKAMTLDGESITYSPDLRRDCTMARIWAMNYKIEKRAKAGLRKPIHLNA